MYTKWWYMCTCVFVVYVCLHTCINKYKDSCKRKCEIGWFEISCRDHAYLVHAVPCSVGSVAVAFVPKVTNTGVYSLLAWESSRAQ